MYRVTCKTQRQWRAEIARRNGRKRKRPHRLGRKTQNRVRAEPQRSAKASAIVHGAEPIRPIEAKPRTRSKLAAFKSPQKPLLGAQAARRACQRERDCDVAVSMPCESRTTARPVRPHGILRGRFMPRINSTLLRFGKFMRGLAAPREPATSDVFDSPQEPELS